MKHLKFLAAVCCMLAVFTACEKNEPSDNTNGNGINTDQNGDSSNTDSSSGSVSAPTGSENGHGYVDLGLPSGAKWATCNVGATTPEEYGNYYAWGETATKSTYEWSTYKYGSDYDELTKYCNKASYGKDSFTDDKTVLEPEDDAAHVNWGGAWRMPTDAEWTELRTSCTWTWTIQNGKSGYEVKGVNGNSIFLPAAGIRSDVGLDRAGDIGYYWSSSLDTDYPGCAWYVYFGSDYVSRGRSSRYCGPSVRPVLFGE